MLFKIVINFYTEKHRKFINKLFELIFILNQLVRTLATILKMSDVKNTAHGRIRTLYFFKVTHEIISEIVQVNTRHEIRRMIFYSL